MYICLGKESLLYRIENNSRALILSVSLYQPFKNTIVLEGGVGERQIDSKIQTFHIITFE